jgi:hypothetical protein
MALAVRSLARYVTAGFAFCPDEVRRGVARRRRIGTDVIHLQKSALFLLAIQLLLNVLLPRGLAYGVSIADARIQWKAGFRKTTVTPYRV